MALCTQNLTIGVYSVEGSGFAELKNNRMEGLVGKELDKFLKYKNQR